MISYEAFVKNYQRVRERMAAACQQCGRAEESVRLLPVTKTHPFDVAFFVNQVGLSAAGENRVQEAAQKKPLAPAALHWELIGHLQSNKVKQAVQVFDRIQTVDSLELAKRIDRLSGESGRLMPVLIQANAGADPAKFGLADFSSLRTLATEMMLLPNLRLEGLMTIPALDESPAVSRKAFETLREWRDQLAEEIGCPLPELSMGMSGDLEIAIAAGSTLVRVGSALFGVR